MKQEELKEELIVSSIPYMICSLCDMNIGYKEGQEDMMEQHFKEEHELKDDEE